MRGKWLLDVKHPPIKAPRLPHEFPLQVCLWSEASYYAYFFSVQ